jgi:coenzyme F420-0:L-glutamate ligase/coenzyme F420-1:gamma-L-glutamate ligase
VKVAVVPARAFNRAKQRLRDSLDPAARPGLARAMLEDVLAALAGAGLDRVLVVTDDAEVARVAEAHGATAVVEPEALGHTEAVARGIEVAREMGATVVLTVPGDVPCLTRDEVARMLAALGPPPSVVLVPSRSGVGTNGAALAPPDVMPLRFGEPSFPDHLATARARGLAPVVLELPGAGLDIDRPEDLVGLQALGAGTRASAALAAAGGPRLAGPSRVEVLGLRGLPEVRPGDDVVALTLAAAAAQGTPLRDRDVVVVSQKVVSKAEGRRVRLDDITPSPFAIEVGQAQKKDPRLIELILRESRRVVRMDKGILITETHHGQICANAGVDQSNVGLGWATLLPADPDASARGLAERFRSRGGVEVAVIVADTFGRPWREGLHNVAIGVAGLRPLHTYLGVTDGHGYVLQATILAVADELAGAAELVMGKLDAVPVAIIRGYAYEAGSGSARELLRDPALDLFR